MESGRKLFTRLAAGAAVATAVLGSVPSPAHAVPYAAFPRRNITIVESVRGDGWDAAFRQAVRGWNSTGVVHLTIETAPNPSLACNAPRWAFRVCAYRAGDGVDAQFIDGAGRGLGTSAVVNEAWGSVSDNPRRAMCYYLGFALGLPRRPSAVYSCMSYTPGRVDGGATPGDVDRANLAALYANVPW